MRPTISIIALSQIKEVVIGVPDYKCEIPFGYLFVAPKCRWEGILLEYISDFTNHEKVSKGNNDSDSDNGEMSSGSMGSEGEDSEREDIEISSEEEQNEEEDNDDSNDEE